MEEARQKKMTKILFIIYVFFLSWVILLKMQVDFSIFQMQRRTINLIPFAASVITNGRLDLSEILFNIAAFVPFGVYISMLKPNWSFLKKIAPAFLCSFIYEALQYAAGIGASDITDLIGNTLGGALGIALYFLLSNILKKNTIKIILILAGIGTVFILMLSGILVIANL